MPEPYAVRIEALRAGIENAGIAAAVLSRPQHVFYYSGTMPGREPHFLVVTPRMVMAVAPAGLPGVGTFVYSSYDIHKGWSVPDAAAAALEQALSVAGTVGKTLGVELPFLGANFLPVVQKRSADCLDIGDLLWRLRRYRDAGEMLQIEANIVANDRLHARLRALIRAGAAEFDLWGTFIPICARPLGALWG